MKKHVIEKIKESLILSIRSLGKEAFIRSQQVVPVITGNLKRSGRIFEIENGILIQYLAPYASFVERGIPPHWEEVKSHYRKSGVYVKTFMRYIPKREGKKYIGNPMKNTFKNLSRVFNLELSAKFKKVYKI